MPQYLLGKILTHVSSVVSVFAENLISKCMKGYIQERNLMNVSSVANVFRVQEA